MSSVASWYGARRRSAASTCSRVQSESAAAGLKKSLAARASAGAARAVNVNNPAVSVRTEAMRMVEQGGVRINGERAEDKGLVLRAGETVVLQVGKRKFASVVLL